MTPWAIKQAHDHPRSSCRLAIGMSWIPENFIKQMTFPTYVVILILLIVVEMVGFVGKGAQRWVDLGFIRLQPSEFMKPAIVLVLARFYDLLPAGDVRRWRGLWPAALLVLVPWALILVQPDLGTATMVLLGGVTVMFVAGLPMWYFLSAAGAVAVGAADPLRDDARISAQARADLPRPRKRSARRRLSHQPVEDRDRIGRDLGQGLSQRQPEPPRLSPRRPYRLRLRDHGRGMGAGRRRHC